MGQPVWPAARGGLSWADILVTYIKISPTQKYINPLWAGPNGPDRSK